MPLCSIILTTWGEMSMSQSSNIKQYGIETIGKYFSHVSRRNEQISFSECYYPGMETLSSENLWSGEKRTEEGKEEWGCERRNYRTSPRRRVRRNCNILQKWRSQKEEVWGNKTTASFQGGNWYPFANQLDSINMVTLNKFSLFDFSLLCISVSSTEDTCLSLNWEDFWDPYCKPKNSGNLVRKGLIRK